jgi:hypothetical protein
MIRGKRQHVIKKLTKSVLAKQWQFIINLNHPFQKMLAKVIWKGVIAH